MTRLIWGQAGIKVYESGLDRGVLYLPSGLAVPWNGLVSVDETTTEDASEPAYLDGVMFYQSQTISDYEATLQAFTYPEEFQDFEGIDSVDPGLYVTNQPTMRFGLSYRTKIGNDVSGLDLGYKIHILYNLSAEPLPVNYESLSNITKPVLFGWTLTSIPEDLNGYRPTAHIIIDSRYIDPNMLESIEDRLYGNSIREPALLGALSDLADYVAFGQLILITDNGDGTWTADGPSSLLTMTDATTFQITGVNGSYSDAVTYSISSTPY